jgi:hypothetical protein
VTGGQSSDKEVSCFKCGAKQYLPVGSAAHTCTSCGAVGHVLKHKPCGRTTLVWAPASQRTPVIYKCGCGRSVGWSDPAWKLDPESVQPALRSRARAEQDAKRVEKAASEEAERQARELIDPAPRTVTAAGIIAGAQAGAACVLLLLLMLRGLLPTAPVWLLLVVLVGAAVVLLLVQMLERTPAPTGHWLAVVLVVVLFGALLIAAAPLAILKNKRESGRVGVMLVQAIIAAVAIVVSIGAVDLIVIWFAVAFAASSLAVIALLSTRSAAGWARRRP